MPDTVPGPCRWEHSTAGHHTPLYNKAAFPKTMKEPALFIHFHLLVLLFVGFPLQSYQNMVLGNPSGCVPAAVLPADPIGGR